MRANAPLQIAVAAAIALSGAPALGQSDPQGAAQPPAGARLIPYEEFRTLFIGKTAVFVLEDGAPWGREYYDPDGLRVTFEHVDGSCIEGVWTRQGDYDCFDYPTGTSCWLTYEIDGQLQVQARGGQIQNIVEIQENEPFYCEPQLIGRASPLTTPIERSAL